MAEDDFETRLRTIDRRHQAFLDHLHLLDQRDTALLQRLEHLDDLLAGQTGQTEQVADTQQSPPACG